MKRESPRLAPQRPIGGFRLPTVPDIGDFASGRVTRVRALWTYRGIPAAIPPARYIYLYTAQLEYRTSGNDYANVPRDYFPSRSRASAATARPSRSAMAPASCSCTLWSPPRAVNTR